MLTAETIKIRNFLHFHALVLDQSVLQWGLNDILWESEKTIIPNNDY